MAQHLSKFRVFTYLFSPSGKLRTVMGIAVLKSEKNKSQDGRCALTRAHRLRCRSPTIASKDSQGNRIPRAPAKNEAIAGGHLYALSEQSWVPHRKPLIRSQNKKHIIKGRSGRHCDAELMSQNWPD
jgi:hypothetical protein